MYLVTGGSGFLGVRLVKRLIAQGHSIRLLDTQFSDELPKGIEFIQADIRDGSTVETACRGVEKIFHLVGLMPQSRADSKTMHAVNVEGTENILRGAVKYRTKRIVFTSSLEIYGPPVTVPITENHPLNPIGEYGRNKREAEELCLRYQREKGVEVVILRPSAIVGGGITEKLFLKGLERIAAGKLIPYLGKGDNRFQMTGVSDCVEACILGGKVEGISGEAFNIGADNTLSWKEQVQQIKRLTGSRSRIISLPVGLTKAVLGILNFFALFPLEPDHYRMADCDLVMDCSKAKKLLGWKPRQTNLDMFMEAYNWYVTHH